VAIALAGAETFSAWAGIDFGKPASWEPSSPTSSWKPRAPATFVYNSAQKYLIGGFDGDDKKVLDGTVAGVSWGFFLNPENNIVSTGDQDVESFYWRWRCRLKSGFGASTLMVFRDSGSFTRISIGVDASGYLVIDGTNISPTTTTKQLSSGIVYRIELMARMGTSVGEWELRVDGETIDSASGVNFGSAVVQKALFYGSNDYHQIGDCVWGFGDGALSESVCVWIETPDVEAKVVRLRAANFGAHNDWPTEDGVDVNNDPETNHVAIVTGPEIGTDGVPGGGDAPRIECTLSDLNARENFRHIALPDYPGLADGTEAIRLVVQSAWLGNSGNGGSERPILFEAVVDGTAYGNPLGNAELYDVLLNPRWLMLPWYLNPDTSGSWDRDALNAAYFGVKRVNNLNETQYLMHHELTVVVGGLIEGCGLVVPPTTDEPEEEEGLCDPKSDLWFLDSAARFDGRNIKLGIEKTDITLTISGASYDANDTVTLTASDDQFDSDQVTDGRMYRVAGADGEAVRVTLTSYTSATEVDGTLEADAPDSVKAIATLDWELQKQVISLPWLEGESVGVVADGIVKYATPSTKTLYVVTNGIITLDDMYGVVIAGLVYDSDMQTLPIDPPQEAVTGNQKVVPQVGVLCQYTRKILVGEDGDQVLAEYVIDPNADPLDLPTDKVQYIIPTQWDNEGRVYVRQEEPLPMTILALLPDAVIGGLGSV
jgi:hypothetical protein